MKQLLYKEYKEQRGTGSFASYLLLALPPLMTIPVTTEVRSAMYQVLASQPGVRDLGQARDVAGQRGSALAVDWHSTGCGGEMPMHMGPPPRFTFSSCGVQQLLIVNPSTWLPIAEELRYTSLPPGQSWSAPDGLFSYELFSAAYWTNQNPPAR
jgi:hypothetical protein